jgi:hypothetical protein
MNIDIETPLKKIEDLFKAMDFSKVEVPLPVEPEKTEPIQNTVSKIARAAETVHNVLGDNFFDIEFDGNRIVVTEKGAVNADQEYPNLIASLVEYMIESGMNVTPLPEIRIVKDPEQSKSFFGKTAYYDPAAKEIVLYAMGRHKKDVVRSFAHEMIHHIQNLEGRIGGIETTNTNEDDHLLELEKEAYLLGNITFRNWEDKIKNGQ